MPNEWNTRSKYMHRSNLQIVAKFLWLISLSLKIYLLRLESRSYTQSQSHEEIEFIDTCFCKYDIILTSVRFSMNSKK